ncbi:MAG: hypothetical protein ACI9ES_003327 [Oceanospirillaceae bacterium]|jgi:hypothetical protein
MVKHALTNTVTRQLVKVEKLTNDLYASVDEFYAREIDKKYVESSQLDSKILLQSKRDPNNSAVREFTFLKENLDQVIKPFQQNNRFILDKIIDILINKNNPKRHLEIVLGTILLNYPIDKLDVKFSKRIKISETLRPMYQSALVSLLMDKMLKDGFQFKTPYLAQWLADYNKWDIEHKSTALIQLQKLFVEIIHLKEMGLHSPKSKEILSRAGQNNLLDNHNRQELHAQSKLNAKEFHHYGIGGLEVNADYSAAKELAAQRMDVSGVDGKPYEKAEIKEWRENQAKKVAERESKAEHLANMQHTERFAFIKDVMDPKGGKVAEIEALLKVCQVYSSFILSVKTNVDQELHIKAYNMMAQQAEAKQINGYFTEQLLLMMGRFPIGSGLYFTDLRRHNNDYGTIDKAIVIGINPVLVDEPIVRRVTTNYKYRIDSNYGTVPRVANLYFPEARDPKRFTEKLKVRFKTQFKTDDNNILFSFRANDAFRTLSISETKLW